MSMAHKQNPLFQQFNRHHWTHNFFYYLDSRITLVSCQSFAIVHSSRKNAELTWDTSYLLCPQNTVTTDTHSQENITMVLPPFIISTGQ